MTKSFAELNDAVIQWAIDRDLIQQNPQAQLCKTLEEYQELVLAHHQGDTEETIDAIGDVQITILIYCAQRGIHPIQTFQHHQFVDAEYFGDIWNPLTDAPPTQCDIEAGALHWARLWYANRDLDREDVMPYIADYYYWLLRYCHAHRHDPIKCLEHAYDQIRDRSGKIFGGQFVKQEDFGAGA